MSSAFLDVAAVKDAVDIVNIIAQSVTLERSGSYFKASCPFHKDSNPSLIVYPQSQRFRCYGCGKGGDVIEWVRVLYNLDFLGALDKLGANGGVQPSTRRVQIGKKNLRGPLSMDIVNFWHKQLDSKRRSYFYDRLFTDETIDRERFGWTGDRYAIPIWDKSPDNGGSACQVKFRRSDALERTRLIAAGLSGTQLESELQIIPKYMGMRDRGIWLYDGWKTLGAQKIVVFFGELDAALFNQDHAHISRVAACSPTGGAQSWDTKWLRFFRSADVVIVVPDVGEEVQGRKFAAKVGGHSRLASLAAGNEKDYIELRQIMTAKSIVELLEVPNEQS